jgi:MFS family permease
VTDPAADEAVEPSTSGAESARGGGRLVSRLGRVAADISPLRDNRPFRWLFVGQAVSVAGTQVTQVAVPLQVYAISHSSLAVGFVGLAALVPLVLLGLYGGAIADAVEKRRLILTTSTGSAVVSGVLVLLAAAHLSRVWPLYACVAAQSAFFAVDSPGRRSIVPRIVRPQRLAAANTLFMVVMNLGVVIGPLLAGGLIAALGYQAAYGFDVASFAVAIVAVAGGLPRLPPAHGVRPAGLASIIEGLRFLRPRHVLLMTFLIDIVAMVFGMPRALFPALAVHHYGGGATTAGLLYAAPAAGALLVAITGGWMTRVRRQGLGIIVAVLGWGGSITVFGLAPWLGVGLLMLALAGAADSISAVFRTTMLQVGAPDDMQGRLSGVFIVVVAGGPRLGDLEAGAVANAFGLTFSVVSGGLACVALTVVLAALVPRFVGYDARHPTP